MNRVQRALKKAKDEGIITNDIESPLNKREATKDDETSQLNLELINTNNILSVEEFIKAWETNNQRGQIRPTLLIKVILFFK